jgi:hypothetical protein
MLRKSSISPVVEEFIETHIESLDALEILLLLRSRQDREFSALAISRALALNETAVTARLEEISPACVVSDRVANGERLYRYAPERAELASIVDEVASAYATYPVGVTRLIFSRPESKVRTWPHTAS